MRRNLTKKHFTRAERVFGEILKRNRIPFSAKVKVQEREVDFIVGKYAIEINGHEQISAKNHLLVAAGLVPIHFSNVDILNSPEKVEKIITSL